MPLNTALLNGTELLLLGSGKNMIIGKVKTAHQIATVKNDILMAVDESGIPNQSGCRYINTFTANNDPPPRYPKEYPNADT